MKLRRADHIAWRQIDDELILVDLAAKEMFGLDEAAALLWRAFEGPQDVAALLASVVEASHGAVDAESLERFVQQLVDAHLLVVSEGPAPVADASKPLGLALSAPPQVLWREAVRQAAGTCAFLPGSGPLCNQAPFS